LDPARETSFICCAELGLGFVLVTAFGERLSLGRRLEENCARDYSPWNGATQARGMEFGTTPCPLANSDIFRMGKSLCYGLVGNVFRLVEKATCSHGVLAAVSKSWRFHS